MPIPPAPIPRAPCNPCTLELLKRLDYDITRFRSKPWDEFAQPGAPKLDFVITVCDSAAAEACPIWPGHPMTGALGHARSGRDRAGFAVLSDIALAFAETYRMLDKPPQPVRQSENDGPEPNGAAKERGQEHCEEKMITIYHNPDCGTSRNVLGLIRNCGAEPHIIEYLKTPPSRAELVSLLEQMGITPRQLLREKGTPFHALKLGDPKWSDAELIDTMIAHPILINRPIVVTPLGARLCRPSETVLDILPDPQLGPFNKEGVRRRAGRGCEWQPADLTMPAISRRLAAEFLGTLLLLATVVGSGIMAERLCGGNVALALLANALATGAVLVVLITVFAPLSGAQFPNPSPSRSILQLRRRNPILASLLFMLTQCVAAVAGVWLAA